MARIVRRVRCLGAAVLLGLVLGALPTPAGASPAVTVQDVVPTRVLVQRLLEDRVLALTNVERRRHGCPALRANAYLRKSARGHTVTMALHDLMSHQLPGEPYFSKRITRAGYRDWSLVAENVARGFSGPAAVVRAWMASPSHRRNILNCRLRDLGVGVALEDGQLWWTQNFGRKW
ncbi:MAG TPA: CAP domain-containing protein [Nocardioides sp.]|jgi:uncharacterized protein YkwD|nr:CAP domain-containing protein [Nocardioides sp.]